MGELLVIRLSRSSRALQKAQEFLHEFARLFNVRTVGSWPRKRGIQPKLRSTTQRRGRSTKPFLASGSLITSNSIPWLWAAIRGARVWRKTWVLPAIDPAAVKLRSRKKPRQRKMTRGATQSGSGLDTRVEHALAGVKISHIVKDVLRNLKDGYSDLATQAQRPGLFSIASIV